MPTFAGFQQGYFDFFNELAQNNERPWFQENKARYDQEVATPLSAFVRAIAPQLKKISPYMVADSSKNGGSMFRIYRDTRFSKDKTPYKTHGALHFRHGSANGDVHGPGFYLSAGPHEIVVGLGIWRPASESLQKIREAIVDHSDAWLAIRNNPSFCAVWTLSGESLKRPPKGFDKDHPLVTDLQRKDHIGVHELTPVAFMNQNFVEEVAEMYATASPYMKFLCDAMDLPF